MWQNHEQVGNLGERYTGVLGAILSCRFEICQNKKLGEKVNQLKEKY